MNPVVRYTVLIGTSVAIVTIVTAVAFLTHWWVTTS